MDSDNTHSTHDPAHTRSTNTGQEAGHGASALAEEGNLEGAYRTDATPREYNGRIAASALRAAAYAGAADPATLQHINDAHAGVNVLETVTASNVPVASTSPHSAATGLRDDSPARVGYPATGDNPSGVDVGAEFLENVSGGSVPDRPTSAFRVDKPGTRADKPAWAGGILQAAGRKRTGAENILGPAPKRHGTASTNEITLRDGSSTVADVNGHISRANNLHPTTKSGANSLPEQKLYKKDVSSKSSIPTAARGQVTRPKSKVFPFNLNITTGQQAMAYYYERMEELKKGRKKELPPPSGCSTASRLPTPPFEQDDTDSDDNSTSSDDTSSPSVEVLYISPGSDGDQTKWPGSPYERNDEYFLEAVGQKWVQDEYPGGSTPGAEYRLDKLPNGYAGFQKARPDGKLDYYVYGHQTGRFDSVKKFYDHFRYLMAYGTAIGCKCFACDVDGYQHNEAQRKKAKQVEAERKEAQQKDKQHFDAQHKKAVHSDERCRGLPPLLRSDPLYLNKYLGVRLNDARPTAHR